MFRLNRKNFQTHHVIYIFLAFSSIFSVIWSLCNINTHIFTILLLQFFVNNKNLQPKKITCVTRHTEIDLYINY